MIDVFPYKFIFIPYSIPGENQFSHNKCSDADTIVCRIDLFFEGKTVGPGVKLLIHRRIVQRNKYWRNSENQRNLQN